MVVGLFARIVLVSACLGLVAVLGPISGLAQQAGRAGQVATAMGVDADPTGSSATALANIDACVSVGAGQNFDVDIFVADVVDLVGWQATFIYDPSVVRLTETNVELFLTAGEGRRIVDLSDPLPGRDGFYNLAVADLSITMGKTGSGVLARVTLEALRPGASPLTLDHVILADSAANAIGDINGDSLFDGAVGYAQVWVDEPCPSTLPTLTPSPSPTVGPAATPPSAATPTPPPATGEPAEPTPATPGEDDDNSGFPWAIVFGASAGAVVAALALAFVGGRLLRRG